MIKGSDVQSITFFRLGVWALIALLVLPTIVAGISHVGLQPATESQATADSTENITFVTAQGKEFSSDEARLVVYRNDTPIRVHSRYSRYYDIDPLGGDRILFVAGAIDVPESNYTDEFVAVEMNWRTGEIYREFPVPRDTHDIDALGNDTYVYAEKVREKPRFTNKLHVFDYRRGEQVWVYNFTDHFPPYPQAGGDATGYTHVNDVDSVNNGSAFLASPRNFDRVMLINRSTKEVEWTLGEENNHTILNEQHNPALLSQDPVTVLVADSENDRVVEYRRNQSGWELDWAYANLSWPRDADRLPNGNTMIVDSSAHRALEVTPQGEVVWEVSIPFGPYDIERLSLGDEPTGPTAREMGIAGEYGIMEARQNVEENSERPPSTIEQLTNSFEFLYSTSQWVLPSWIGRFQFALLGLVPLVVGIWGSVELSRIWPPNVMARRQRQISRYRSHVAAVAGALAVVLGAISVAISVSAEGYTTFLVGLGVLLLVEGFESVVRSDVSEQPQSRLQTVGQVMLLILRVGAILTAGVLLYRTTTVSGTVPEIYIGIAGLLLLSAVRSPRQY